MLLLKRLICILYRYECRRGAGPARRASVEQRRRAHLLHSHSSSSRGVTIARRHRSFFAACLYSGCSVCCSDSCCALAHPYPALSQPPMPPYSANPKLGFYFILVTRIRCIIQCGREEGILYVQNTCTYCYR